MSAAYGPYRALFDVSFRVPTGGVVALVGSNGAGKSTIARTITGLVTASVGQVVFSGQDVTTLPAYKIARLGMSPRRRGAWRVFEPDRGGESVPCLPPA